MKEETVKHTPTPWKISKKIKNEIVAVNGEVKIGVASYFKSSWRLNNGIGNWDEAEANAEFIVRACNAHDEMVDALKELNAKIDAYWNATPSNRAQYEKGICVVQKKCHELISKSEGK